MDSCLEKYSQTSAASQYPSAPTPIALDCVCMEEWQWAQHLISNELNGDHPYHGQGEDPQARHLGIHLHITLTQRQTTSFILHYLTTKNAQQHHQASPGPCHIEPICIPMVIQQLGCYPQLATLTHQPLLLDPQGELHQPTKLQNSLLSLQLY